MKKLLINIFVLPLAISPLLIANTTMVFVKNENIQQLNINTDQNIAQNVMATNNIQNTNYDIETRDNFKYEFAFGKDSYLSANAHTWTNPISETWSIFSYPLALRDVQKVLRSTTQFIQYENRNESEDTAVKFSSSFGNSLKPGRNQQYSYYSDVPGIINTTEFVKMFTNPLLSESIGQTGYELRAGTVFSFDNQANIFKLHFLFYCKVWVIGGGPTLPYSANLNWNLGKGVILTEW